jgi:hypothetical protein
MDLTFSYPSELIKSGEEINNKIPIKIIPNIPIPDRVNDKILLKAYDEECIKGFLHSGIIDYDHQSILGLTPLQKAEAIIGEPEKFYIDHENKVAVVEGFLFKGNPYVDNVIYPALRAGSKKISASLGGKILQKSDEFDLQSKQKIKTISKISINHVAITPLMKAVNQGAIVSLLKSCSGNGKCKSELKCNSCNKSYEYQFNSFESFIKSFEDEEILKSLEAGTSTSITGMNNGQMIQGQSLEGVDYTKIRNKLPLILNDLINGISTTSAKEYMNYLIAQGFNQPEANEIIELLARNKAKLILIKK